MATAVAASYSGPSGQRVYGGRFPPGGSGLSGSAVLGGMSAGGGMSVAGASVAAGTWQQLTVAPHSRKVITGANVPTAGGDDQPYNGAPTVFVENLAPTTVSAIPAKGNATPVRGERGVFYSVGGQHTNYQGNEVDKITLPTGASTTITTVLPHQPNVPPYGPYGGYSGGFSGYIYKQAGTGLAGLADNSDWQPFWGHTYTKTSWSPFWGFFYIGPHALQASYPNGAYSVIGGVLQSSAAQPTDDHVNGSEPNRNDELGGLVAYDAPTGKYKTYFSETLMSFPLNVTFGRTAVSDWNNYSQRIYFFGTNANTTQIQCWDPNGLRVLTPTTVPGGGDGTSNDGYLLRHLENDKYLYLLNRAASGPFATGCRVYLFNEYMVSSNTADARFYQLTWPSAETADIIDNIAGITFCVDKHSRRIFWLVFPTHNVPIRIYKATFDNPMAWTLITTSNNLIPAITLSHQVWLSGVRQPMHFQDGYLYVLTSLPGANSPGYVDGSQDWRRVKVDAGEDLPAMNFIRYDYRIQDFRFSDSSAFQLSTCKHTNFVYNPADGKHYAIAGDMGGNTNNSIASLQFTGAGPGDYVFAQRMGEATPAPAPYRPTNCDDGHLAYIPATNPITALRGKILWMRGGQGLAFFWNGYMAALFGASPGTSGTEAQRLACRAAGWDIGSPFIAYDPVTNTWPWREDGTTPAWTQEDGSTSWTNLIFPQERTGGDTGLQDWTTSRCGAMDNVMGRALRFYRTNDAFLAIFDFATRHVNKISITTWTSPDTGRVYSFDGGIPPEGTPVVADGPRPAFGWQTSGGAWKTSLSMSDEHKALWFDQRDGKLYVMSPSTGYLWCFETWATLTDSGSGGLKIPFYPVGNRAQLVGVDPPLASAYHWPPAWTSPGTRAFGGTDTIGETTMVSFLVPYKGGLLWWSDGGFSGGAFGHPSFAFWRRLGSLGDWTVVSFPQEFAANSYSVIDPTDINNSEVVFLAGGGNFGERPAGQLWPWFWRMT